MSATRNRSPLKRVLLYLLLGLLAVCLLSGELGNLLRAKGLAKHSQMINLDAWDEESTANVPLVGAVQAVGEALAIPITCLGQWR